MRCIPRQSIGHKQLGLARTGLITVSILVYDFFTIKHHCKKCLLQTTHSQGLRHLL